MDSPTTAPARSSGCSTRCGKSARGPADRGPSGPAGPGARPAAPVALRDAIGGEEGLRRLREYLLDHRGTCGVFFHLGADGGEVVVRASAQIQVSDADDVLAGIREQPQGADT